MISTLPSGWIETTLGECFEWGSGGTPKSKVPEYYGGDIPWAVIGDLEDAPISETARSITVRGFEASSASWVEPGSILLAMYGSIGKLGITTRRLTTNQAIAFTLPDPVDSKFLFWYLRYARPLLYELGKGGTQRNISQTVIKSVPFRLAPLSEQRRIVSKIEQLSSELDAGVAALERAETKLDRYQASVLQAAVEGRLTKAWRTDNPAKESGKELLQRILAERRKRWEEEEQKKREQRPTAASRGRYRPAPENRSRSLPSLPGDWTWSSLGAVCHFTVDYRGKTPPYAETGIPVISAANVKDGRILVDDARFVARATYEKWTTRGLPEPGDVIVTTEAPVAEVALYPTEGEYLLTRRVFACKTNRMNSAFVALALGGSEARQHIRKHLRGTTVPRILKNDLLATPIPIPPRDEQDEIVARAEIFADRASYLSSSLCKSLESSDRLRGSILKTAFEGRLVPQDPDDEPASALLERIRAERDGKQPVKERRTKQEPSQSELEL